MKKKNRKGYGVWVSGDVDSVSKSEIQGFIQQQGRAEVQVVNPCINSPQ